MTARFLVTVPAEGQPKVEPFHFGHRPGRDICPADGQRLDGLGITKLAYTWEACSCSHVPYDHLVEQMWHREHVGAPLPVAP